MIEDTNFHNKNNKGINWKIFEKYCSNCKYKDVCYKDNTTPPLDCPIGNYDSTDW